MSIVPVISAVAAAAAARKKKEEEERMATYNSDDLNGWEFKFVRSTFGKFSSYEAVQKVCAEEARNSWELVEKFDEYRLRFKRRVERRSNDHMATIDPYRTSTGSGSGFVGSLAVGVALLLCGIAALLLFGLRDGGLFSGSSSPAFILLAGLFLVIILVVVMLKKKR